MLHYGLAKDTAVRIASIEPGGPAARAWLRDGDLIVGFDGQSIAAVDDLHRALTWKRINTVVPVTVIRRGEELAIEVMPVEKTG